MGTLGLDLAWQAGPDSDAQNTPFTTRASAWIAETVSHFHVYTDERARDWHAFFISTHENKRLATSLVSQPSFSIVILAQYGECSFYITPLLLIMGMD